MTHCSVAGCNGTVLAKSFCQKHYTRFRKHGTPHVVKKAGVGEPQDWVLKHVNHRGDKCLDWPYGKVPSGYGYCIWNGRLERVSRLMCTLNYGPPESDKLEAAHKCGNARCVNPSHLRWATAQENQKDKLAHGTHNRGEKCASNKLSEIDVLEIRGSTRLPAKWLAKKYGVSHDHIRRLQKPDCPEWFWL
jgi:hypothetical protein